ncbi:MAG TPA: PIN domain-containing protein [Acidimicrobiales bacterium]
MRQMRLFLDAKVLAAGEVRDLVLCLDEMGMIEFRWSEQVLADLRTFLVARLHRPADRSERLCHAIRMAFPLGEVDLDRHREERSRKHVLAAAIACEADIVVTYDRARFSLNDLLEPRDLEILHPDDALQRVCSRLGPQTVAAAFMGVTDKLRDPPGDIEGQLDRLMLSAPKTTLIIASEVAPDLLDEVRAKLDHRVEPGEVELIFRPDLPPRPGWLVPPEIKLTLDIGLDGRVATRSRMFAFVLTPRRTSWGLVTKPISVMWNNGVWDLREIDLPDPDPGAAS